MLQEWLGEQDPERLRHWVYLGQFVLGGALFLLFLYFRARPAPSQFRVREADRKEEKNEKRHGKTSAPSLAEARLPRKETLRLPGIVLEGAPHEILGIAANSGQEQIQKAYRDLMKRYHPDRVGRPGTREWSDAQKIAEAINRAKDEMLKTFHSRNPNRPGR